MPLRVVLTDDHPVVTRGLQALLESFPDIVVVGIAESGETLLDRVADWRPDVVILDLLMPGGLDGVTTMRRMTAAHPQMRVVALTASTDTVRMEAVIEAGALGYVRKDAPAELIVSAVRAVAKGRRFMAASARIDAAATPLSNREREVLQEIAAGRSNREIAARLSVSPETIKSHVASLLAKLDLPNRTALVAHAVSVGLVVLDDR